MKKLTLSSWSETVLDLRTRPSISWFKPSMEDLKGLNGFKGMLIGFAFWQVWDAILGKVSEWSPGRGAPPGIIKPKAAVLSLIDVPSLFVRCNLCLKYFSNFSSLVVCSAGGCRAEWVFFVSLGHSSVYESTNRLISFNVLC